MENSSVNCTLTDGDWLSFFGVIIGIVCSLVITVCLFHFQKNATEDLENRLKFSDMTIGLHEKIRACKINIKNSHKQLLKSGIDSYREVFNEIAFQCRSDLLPYLSGFKVFKKYNFGEKEYLYLKSLDKRLLVYMDLFRDSDFNSDYKLIKNQLNSIDHSDDPKEATLSGLELLLNDCGG